MAYDFHGLAAVLVVFSPFLYYVVYVKKKALMLIELAVFRLAKDGR